MRRYHSFQWNIFSIAGWLFTDLLLAMAVVFLVASSSGEPPKPQPPPCLDLQSTSLTLTVDYQGLLNDDTQAITNVVQQVRDDKQIQGRRAGLVITYGGTPDDSGSDLATQIAKKVNAVLSNLGKANYVFVRTVYHDPLRNVGVDFSTVLVEIYLFALSGQCPA